MSKQRHGGEDDKSCPFCLREPHGLERRNERRLFRHHKLQGESDRQRQNHQPVIHRIHPENRLFHIPHPDRVEKLGQSQDGKGIRLAVRQDHGIFQHFSDPGKCSRSSAPDKKSCRNDQKSGQADQCDKKSVKHRADPASVGKQALSRSSRLLFHQLHSVAHIRPQCQCRQRIRDQVDPKDVACLERGWQRKQDREKHGHDLPKVRRKQKYHRLFDVFIDLSSFLNGIPDRGEIVIRQNDVRRLFCHISPVLSHGDPHISRP